MAKAVLITGGAHRLGADLCRTFARDGWEVWCHHHQSASAAQALCDGLREQLYTAHTIQADLNDDLQRQHMMARIHAESGPLHCLINNASNFEPDSASNLDSEDLRRLLEVNLVAPMKLSALMAQNIPGGDFSGQRSIIHVLDQKVSNLNPDYFSYTLSKLALERAVALQAQALAPKLRVCGVAPGLMFLSGPQTQENFDNASKINLMQHPIDPTQVAASCLFLANNPCITGVTLTVDNGQHLIPLPRDVMFVVQDILKDAHGK